MADDTHGDKAPQSERDPDAQGEPATPAQPPAGQPAQDPPESGPDASAPPDRRSGERRKGDRRKGRGVRPHFLPDRRVRGDRRRWADRRAKR
jgi:hypothetical protein